MSGAFTISSYTASEKCRAIHDLEQGLGRGQFCVPVDSASQAARCSSRPAGAEGRPRMAEGFAGSLESEGGPLLKILSMLSQEIVGLPDRSLRCRMKEVLHFRPCSVRMSS